MLNERENWNRRYARGAHGPATPDPFFLEAYEKYVSRFFPQGGEGLDIAGGTGRHSIWLAQHGWRMTLVDISETGIGQARQNAGLAGVTIDCKAEDLRSTPLPEECFDVVLVFFYLERKLFAPLARALRPGGLLVYKTYTHEAPQRGGGPTHSMHLLEQNELLRAFAGMRVLHYKEPAEGAAVAELVARNC